LFLFLFSFFRIRFRFFFAVRFRLFGFENDEFTEKVVADDRADRGYELYDIFVKMKQRDKNEKHELLHGKRREARAEKRGKLLESRLFALAPAFENKELVRNEREQNGRHPREDVYYKRPPARVLRHARNVDERIVNAVVYRRSEHAESGVKHKFPVL
jgi:hypothetical protein